MASAAYDQRRPRIPAELARQVDEVRGDVPFNRWVVAALEEALGMGPGGTSPASPRAAESPPALRVRRGSESPSMSRFKS